MVVQPNGKVSGSGFVTVPLFQFGGGTWVGHGIGYVVVVQEDIVSFLVGSGGGTEGKRGREGTGRKKGACPGGGALHGAEKHGVGGCIEIEGVSVVLVEPAAT